MHGGRQSAGLELRDMIQEFLCEPKVVADCPAVAIRLFYNRRLSGFAIDGVAFGSARVGLVARRRLLPVCLTHHIDGPIEVCGVRSALSVRGSSWKAVVDKKV